MTFLDFDIDEKDLSAAKFLGETRRGLVDCLLSAKKHDNTVSQASIARKIGMDKSSLSRVLNGQGNITLRTIAEVAWSLGMEPEVYFRSKHHVAQGNAVPREICGAKAARVKSFAWSGTAKNPARTKVRGANQSMRMSHAS